MYFVSFLGKLRDTSLELRHVLQNQWYESSSKGGISVALGLSTFSEVFCQGATIAPPAPEVPAVLAYVLVVIWPWWWLSSIGLQHNFRNPLTRFSWLRHCAISRKVAASIPDGVIRIFYWYNPSGRTMVLGSTQSLTEISTRNISWG